MAAGLCRSSTARRSGMGGVVVEAASGGANDTAFASMRCGSSRMTVTYCRFGRSGDDGDDHPSWAISPQTG